MRISYWSSDVCSSDLPATIGYLGHVRSEIGSIDNVEDAKQQTRPEGMPFPEPENKHGQQHCIDQHRPRDRNAIGRSQAGRIPETQHQQDDHHHQAPVDKGNVYLRSEEHRSELQSLMRISYAVFCLKKQHDIKTQNNDINETHL